MTNEERRKAAEWFRNRAKNCQMPGARRMYEIATEALEMAIRALEGDGDMISRQEVMKEFSDFVRKSNNSDFAQTPTWNDAVSLVGSMPSAQPERTCVNCGRTVNNGGWYADGGTRCPIEEHYALPKDGYCHLWEKRNVTNDDYPERRTNNANIDT